jgi:hypothetical protein
MTKPSENPALSGLVALSNRTGADIRPTLLRVMTDLYLQKPAHTVEEEAEYTRMALKLIDHVDGKTRSMIAGKIAGYPNAPAAVRQRLLKDLIVVKAPEEPAQDHAKERAKESAKESTKESTKERAKERAKERTGGNAEAGAGEGTGKSAIEDAIQRPANDPAKPSTKTAAATPPTALELSELFVTSNAEERRLILLNLPYAPIMPAAPLDAVPAQAAIQLLEASALAHQSEKFVREFARALSISPTQALRLAQDPGGEPVVVAALALGMPAAVLQRILLCLNPAISRSIQRVYDLTLLHEDLTAASALRLVAIWQAADREENKPVASIPTSVPRVPQRAAGDSRPLVPVPRPKIRWDELARKADGG